MLSKTFLHISTFNPLNAELNPICYLMALLGAHHIPHVSRISVKTASNLYVCNAMFFFFVTLRPNAGHGLILEVF
jgi:hypothetical protein